MYTHMYLQIDITVCYMVGCFYSSGPKVGSLFWIHSGVRVGQVWRRSFWAAWLGMEDGPIFKSMLIGETGDMCCSCCIYRPIM